MPTTTTTRSRSAASPLHWTQRPGNRQKVRMVIQAAVAARRAKAAAPHGSTNGATAPPERETPVDHLTLLKRNLLREGAEARKAQLEAELAAVTQLLRDLDR